MPRHGKKYRAAVQNIDRTRKYTVEEAVELLKKSSYVKFDESIDLDVRLGVDPRNADQQVRGTVNLPNGTGKTARVAVFAVGEKAEAALAAGADVVGDWSPFKYDGGFGSIALKRAESLLDQPQRRPKRDALQVNERVNLDLLECFLGDAQ